MIRTSILQICDATRCFDERDRVYALASMEKPRFTVNYDRTVAEVYIAFAAYEIGRGAFKPLLACAASRRPCAPDFPTWVPDWRTPV